MSDTANGTEVSSYSLHTVEAITMTDLTSTAPTVQIEPIHHTIYVAWNAFLRLMEINYPQCFSCPIYTRYSHY